MAAPDANVAQAAKGKVPEYLTLDMKKNKLTVCQTISGHQQQAFLKNGVNALLQKALEDKKQACESLCK